jgi:hypothetical protein
MPQSQAEQELNNWRRWAGLEVLAHLSLIHASSSGRPIVERAMARAYALIFGTPGESGLAIDIEILGRLASDGSWNVAEHISECRRVLANGRTQDPFAALVASLLAKVEAGSADGSFVQGVSATQAFYQGDPDRLLSRLRLIAQPFAGVVDLGILDGGPGDSAESQPDAAPAPAPEAEAALDVTAEVIPPSVGNPEDRNTNKSIGGDDADGGGPARDDEALIASQKLHPPA